MMRLCAHKRSASLWGFALIQSTHFTIVKHSTSAFRSCSNYVSGFAVSQLPVVVRVLIPSFRLSELSRHYEHAADVRQTRAHRSHQGRRAVAHARQGGQYMTGLPTQRARYQAWQFAAKLFLGGDDAEALTQRIEYALFLDGRRRF